MEDLDTELLGQLQRWHEEDQYQRIIDAIEAIPQRERGYELTCQLARAYNNLAGPEEAGPLEKSVSLLESIADQGQEDPLWHYRLGYALFYLDREEEALPHFQRAAELDPQDPDAAEFIRQCQKYIAAKQCCPEVYGQEDWDTVDQHIHTYFGSSENVFHEIVSPDIHVDIYIIPPSPERNYYILMTHGMGAHAMNVPEDLAGQKLERAELFICLPPDWKVGEEGEAWYWPIRWLKILARLPINEDSWLGWGHTIANPDGSPFAENTRFNGIMLVSFACSLALMFVARPAAVFICLFKSGYTLNEKLFISWAGLKGAVPIILATYPLMERFPNSQFLFNLIFFLVIISVLFQGKTLAPLAHRLKLEDRN